MLKPQNVQHLEESIGDFITKVHVFASSNEHRNFDSALDANT